MGDDMKYCRKGFTLLEILIVIIIVSVLATLALGKYMRTIEQAKVAEAIRAVGIIKRAIISYRYVAGQSPIMNNGVIMCGNDTFNSMGLLVEIPPSSFFEYCISTSDNSGFKDGFKVEGNVDNIRITARNPFGVNSSNIGSLSVNLNEEGVGFYKFRDDKRPHPFSHKN